MPSVIRIKNSPQAKWLQVDDGGVSLIDDDLNHWLGSIEGAQGTPYQGGLFLLDIKFLPSHPYPSPKVKLITKICHPNISSVSGTICLDILKEQWNPSFFVRTMLLSIQPLLSDAEPNDPIDPIIAAQYKHNRSLFESHIREWVKKYASPEVNTALALKLTKKKFQNNPLLQSLGQEMKKAIISRWRS